MSEEKKLYFYLSEILEDPEVAKPPQSVVPYLAWQERVTLLAAREKGGKSTLASAAVSAASAGKEFLGEMTEPQTVLWISLEEHISEISRRFIDFGADPGRIIVANAFLDPYKDIPEICKDVSPSIIVWDTLGAFADAVALRPIEPGDSAQWTRIVRWITTMSRAHGASSIILHHARKSDGRYRDSTAIGANVDVILEMFGEKNDPRTLKGIGRWMIPETRVVMREGAFFLVGEDSLKKEIVAFVKRHPGCSWRDLRSGVQGRDSDVKKARDELLEEKKLLNKGEGAHEYHAPILVST